MFRSELEVKCGEFDIAYETFLCFFFGGNNLISVDTIEVPVKIANFRGSRCFRVWQCCDRCCSSRWGCRSYSENA